MEWCVEYTHLDCQSGLAGPILSLWAFQVEPLSIDKPAKRCCLVSFAVTVYTRRAVLSLHLAN